MERKRIEIRGERARTLIGKIPSVYLRYGILAVVAVLLLTVTVLCLIKVPGYESYEIIISNESSDIGDNGFIIIPTRQHLELSRGVRFIVYEENSGKYSNTQIREIIQLGDIELITAKIDTRFATDISSYKALIPSQRHSIIEWIIAPDSPGKTGSNFPKMELEN